jgi:hypothetical protein
MASRSRNDVTPDEVIALLKRTSLPTLVVEGSDDIIVYRTFERDLADLNVSVLPVGGRSNVLEVFRRKHEIPHTKVSFIADQDVWVTVGVPATYAHQALIFTAGYSIENDVFIDGQLETLLKGAESGVFATELNAFTRWYALALSRHIAGGTDPIALHPNHVLDGGRLPTLMALAAGESYPLALFNKVFGDYKLQLRGKALFALLLRRTNAKGRGVQHSVVGLMEAVSIRPGTLLTRLVKSVRAALA